MDEILGELVEFVRNASPLFWAVLMKQVYAEAFQRVLWAALLIVALPFCIKLGNYFGKEEGYSNDYLGAAIACYVLSAVSFAMALVLLTQAGIMLYNPEFYAITKIIEHLR